VKVHRPGHKKPVKIPSGPTMTAKQMVADVKKVAAGWNYSAVSIGYPALWFTDDPSANHTILGAVGLPRQDIFIRALAMERSLRRLASPSGED